MSVIRVNKTRDYTVMSNSHLRDKSLSLKAKGLMSQMLSLPDDWDYSIAGLVSINQEAESAIKAALKELKEAGYLVITKLSPDKTASGRYEYVYDLYEEKQGIKKQEVENQPLEILPVEILPVENHPLNKYIEEQNKEEQNKERPSKESIKDVLENSKLISSSPSLREAVQGFIEMRKGMKKPLTPRALRMALEKATEYGEGDAEKIQAVFDQSTMNGWLGVFPLKEEKQIDFFHTQSPRPSSNPFADMMRQEGYV